MESAYVVRHEESEMLRVFTEKQRKRALHGRTIHKYHCLCPKFLPWIKEAVRRLVQAFLALDILLTMALYVRDFILIAD